MLRLFRQGVRGGVEYGFSSTTMEREQAVAYADGAASTVFEMQMGLVDRGAELTWLSQARNRHVTATYPPRNRHVTAELTWLSQARNRRVIAV